LPSCKQINAALPQMFALVGERKGFGVGSCKTKVLADFLIGSAETGSTRSTPEAAHGRVALLDGSVISLDSIVEVWVGAVNDSEAQSRLDGLRIGGVLIRRHTLRLVTDRRQRLFEEGLRCFEVTGGTQPNIDQIAVTVDGAIQVLPAAIDVP